MKLTHLKMTALAGLAAVALTAPSAMALTYNADDLFLGFRQDGNTNQDFIVNLGQASTFRDATVPFTLTLTNLNSQLTTLFGSTWKTDGTVLWALVGTPGSQPVGSDPGDILYSSRPADSANYLTTPVPSTGSNQAGPSNNILSMKNYYLLPTTPDGTVANSEIGNPANSNSWSTRASTDFGSGNIGPIENYTNGLGLDLFRVPEGSPSTTLATNEGRLTLGSGDNVTFSPVPEPSTALMLGMALSGVLGFRRNRKTTLA